MSTTDRTAGSLNSDDLGAIVTIETRHTTLRGELESVEHVGAERVVTWGGETVRVYSDVTIQVKGIGGASLTQTVTADKLILVDKGDAS